MGIRAEFSSAQRYVESSCSYFKPDNHRIGTAIPGSYAMPRMNIHCHQMEMLTRLLGSSVPGINVQSWSFRGVFLKVDRIGIEHVEKKTLPFCYDEVWSFSLRATWPCSIVKSLSWVMSGQRREWETSPSWCPGW